MIVVYPPGFFLEGKERNVTSQNGEDGLIFECLREMGVANRWCFEVGAADGKELSNTYALRKLGWHAVLIEANEHEYAKLKCFQSGKVHCVHKKIDTDPLRQNRLDAILERCGAPDPLDFGVIDVDGQDYWILKTLKRLPRLILVEFNASTTARIPTENIPNAQAGEYDIKGLMRERGYKVLAKVGCNLLGMLP